MVRLRFALLFLLLSCNAVAQQSTADFQKQMNEALYGGLRKIDSFGLIHVHVKNAAEDRIGLKSDELTDYLKLRFKNNFSNVPYRDQSANLFQLPNPEKVGYFWCGVWTVGDNYPVAYHIECKAGSIEKPTILTDAVLGYGNRSNVPDTIKKSIDDMVSQFAIQFYRTRGEM